MKRTILLLGAIIVAVSMCGCTSHPVMNLQGYSVPSLEDGSLQSAEAVQNAIITACKVRGWTPKVVNEGLIQAEIDIRAKHRAVVEIPFTSTEYSIIYKDSEGMEYEQKSGKIHRNYNRWVTMLSQTIQRELGVKSQRF